MTEQPAGEPRSQPLLCWRRLGAGPTALVLVACGCFLALTISLGPLFSADSEAYVVLTDSLARHHTYTMPYIEATPRSLVYGGEGHNPPPWPPGYPFLSAVLMKLSALSAASAAQWVEIITGLLTLLLLPCICLRLGAGRWLAAAGSLLFALAPATILLAPYVWSETTYMVPLLLVLLLLTQRGELTWRRALLIGLFTAAACLVRYAGAALIITVAVCLLARYRRRILIFLPRIALAVALGAFGEAAWFLRNRLVTGEFEASRAAGANSFLYNLGQALKAILSMLIGQHEGKAVFILLLGLGLLMLLVLVIRQWRAVASDIRWPLLCALVFVIVHAGWTALARTITGFEPIQIRYLWPTLPVLIAIALGLLQGLLAVSPRRPWPMAAVTVAVLGHLGCSGLTALTMSRVEAPAVKMATLKRAQMSHDPAVQTLVRNRSILMVDTFPAPLAELAHSASRVWYMSPYAFSIRDFRSPGPWRDWLGGIDVVLSPTPLSLDPQEWSPRQVSGGATAYLRQQSSAHTP